MYAYADGSMLQTDQGRRVGMGFVLYLCNRTVHSDAVALGDAAEVYDAEMLALAKACEAAVELALTTHINVHTLHFFSDNSAAVDTAFTPSPGPSQRFAIRFREQALRFLDADRRNKLELAWVPGHTQVAGNERAERERENLGFVCR